MEKRLGMRVRRKVMNLGMKRTFNKGRLANKVRGMEGVDHEHHRDDSERHDSERHDDEHREEARSHHNMEKRRRRK